MLVNHILFWMMVTEAMICLVVSLPFGKAASITIIDFLSKYFGGRDSKASLVATITLAIVAIMFLSDVSTVYKYHSPNTMLSDGMRIRLLAAQRDMYISGFCLFLFLLLRLVYLSTATNLRLEKSLGAMKKQAEGASSGYKSLLEENESLTKQMEKVHKLLGSSDEVDDEDVTEKKKKVDVLAKLVEENSTLTMKLEAAVKEIKATEAKVDIVKKQAEGQSTAFMKLLDEKNASDKNAALVKEQAEKLARQEEQIKVLKEDRDALKSQIQDYDFMFAEAKKKAE